MPPSTEIKIVLATSEFPTDDDLTSLLHKVYVDEGFTSDKHAEEILGATAVRRRGDLFVALAGPESLLVGTVILVPPGSPSQQLAVGDEEAELHLLAVPPAYRKLGIGRQLVSRALKEARSRGILRVLLWTQPTMRAAQRLYDDVGFVRIPSRDFRRYERDFLVMQVEL